LGTRIEPTDEERGLYQDLCLYVLYYRYHTAFLELVSNPNAHQSGRQAEFYEEFRRDFERFLGPREVGWPPSQTPEHIFSCFFQLRRAFHFTFRSIAGGSMPAARLRARAWQSVFSHDLRRYQRALYRRMGDITTLVTGPSGAGKELVARAIGHSRYLPFDPASCTFRESFEESFFPLNLSALSPTLIESELFGHKRGSFTGAVSERKGWLEVCPPLGTVFLDEIGEIEAEIQVKLLRVLETRSFQPLGSTDERTFRGKVIAATNRDLGLEMREGRFREDLYYRLCSDTIVTPSLRERLADSPDELHTLLEFLAERLVGAEEAPALAREAGDWILQHLGQDYAWPGNVRELSHCISNVLIHRDYRPVDASVPGSRKQQLVERFLAGQLEADELLAGYCTLVYARTDNYVEAARLLGLDRRTVKGRIDRRLLAELRGTLDRREET
jgi:transcriptional regulator with PAS, ATPase and Fis domain